LKNYGTLIAKLRKQNGITQEQLGKQLSVTYQAVSKWENNLSEPDLETLEKLVEIFGITISEFFDMAKNLDNENSNSKSETNILKTDLTENNITINSQNNETKNTENNLNSTSANIDQFTQKTTFKQKINHLLNNKPWYVILGFAGLIVILSLFAILYPIKYSSNQIYETVNPSVFCITTENGDYKQAGSGFFINKKGLAVTNYHVIKNCTSAKIQTSDGKTYNVEKLVGCDEKKDIAIIQIDIKHSKPVSIGNSNNISVGDSVYAIGYPESFELGSIDSTFTQGIISKTSYTIEENSYIQSTVNITNGNSGGVLINKYAQVIGITTLGSENVDYMNMSIPINELKNVEKNLNYTLSEYKDLHKTFTFYANIYYSDDYYIYSSQSVLVGDTIKKASDPKKTGYTFDGWYTDTTFTTPFNFDEPIKDIFSCYAKFIPNSYTIRFDANGANGVMDDITVKYDEEITLPSIGFTMDEHSFDYWSIEGGDSSEFPNKSTININNLILFSDLDLKPNDIIIFKANWILNYYLIQFDANGGTGTMEDVKLSLDTEFFTLPYNEFTKENHVFGGWKHNHSNYLETDSIYIGYGDRIKVISAIWLPNYYTITFNPNGGTGNMPDIQVPFDEDYTLPANTFTKENYYFDKWIVDDTSQTLNDMHIINNLTTDKYNPNITLTAVWRTASLVINFDGNLATNGTMYKFIISYNSSVNLPQNSFSKTGYIFSHWTDGTKNYNDGEIITNSSPDEQQLTLKAIWTPITYTIKFCCNNDSVTQTFTYDVKQKLLPNSFTMPIGYQFSHWWQELSYDSKGKTYNDCEEILNLSTVPTTIIFYAQSIGNTYYIRYNSNIENVEPIIKEYCYNQSFTIDKNIFTNEGYKLINWKDKNENNFEIGTNYKNLSSNHLEIIDLYANWEVFTFLVKFKDSNNSDLSSEIYSYFDTITIPSFTGTISDGYTFSHWIFYNTPNAILCYPNDITSELGKIAFKKTYLSSVTFYPVFEPITYYIEFDSNGGAGEMQNQACKYDEEISVSKNIFTKSNYDFIYWEYNGQKIYEEDIIENLSSIDGDIIKFTAVWVEALDGNGTESNPYKISSAENFESFIILYNQGKYLETSYFEITANIDLKNEKIDSILEFYGNFNGNNYSLSNFKIANFDYEYTSLFIKNHGTIKNFNISNVTINGGNDIALFVGQNDGDIFNCSANGNISLPNFSSGTIAGFVNINFKNIRNCSVDAIITAKAHKKSSIAGFVSQNIYFDDDTATITNCYSNSTITFEFTSSYNIFIAGFSNYSQGKFNQCYSNTVVNLPKVTNLNDFTFAGFSSNIPYYYFPEITNCFASTNLIIDVTNITDDNYIYDFEPSSNSDSIIENNYVSSNFKITVNSEPFNFTPKTEVVDDENLKDEKWMQENLFKSIGIWKYDGNNYPTLIKDNISTFSINSLDEFLTLNGMDLNINCKLNCDIDLKDTKFKIGINYGNFDGNGHIISNYTISSYNGSYYISLFTENIGTIKNLGLDNLNINYTYECEYVAGLVAINKGAIYNSYVKGSIYVNQNKFYNKVGGICAENFGGIIKNCYSIADITSKSNSNVKIGGISAINHSNGQIQNCFTSGNIKCSSTDGDFAGVYGIANTYNYDENTNSNVTNCFSLANLTIDCTSHDAMFLGQIYIEQTSKVSTNSYGSTSQLLNRNDEIITPTGKSISQLLKTSFLISLNFKAFVSSENMLINTNAVWILSDNNLPKLWFET